MAGIPERVDKLEVQVEENKRRVGAAGKRIEDMGEEQLVELFDRMRALELRVKALDGLEY